MSKCYCTRLIFKKGRVRANKLTIIAPNKHTGWVCLQMRAVLRIWDVHPGSWVKKIPDSGSWSWSWSASTSTSASASKNVSTLTQKIVSSLSDIWTGMFIPDPDLDFLPIPDPGVKKALDSGSGRRNTGWGSIYLSTRGVVAASSFSSVERRARTSWLSSLVTAEGIYTWVLVVWWPSLPSPVWSGGPAPPGSAVWFGSSLSSPSPGTENIQERG